MEGNFRIQGPSEVGFLMRYFWILMPPLGLGGIGVTMRYEDCLRCLSQ